MTQQHKMTGHFVERCRGYVIREWTGDDITAGRVDPFTTQVDGTFEYARHATLADARAFAAAAVPLKRVECSLAVLVPADVSDDHVAEWLRYVVGGNGSIRMSNPLIDRSWEPVEFLIDSTKDLR